MSDTIRLLGPVTAQVGGSRITHFRSQKTLAILAYLIVERRQISRDYLGEMFWPDAPVAEGRGHLRKALYDLSHKLPDRILIERDIVAFNPRFADDIDVYRFDQLMAVNDTGSLEAAAELSLGEFLEGLTVTNCPLFENWLWSERERWRRKTVAVIGLLCDRHGRNARYDSAVDCAWRLVKLQPWREDHYRELMVLLVRSGDLAMALKVYKRCRRLLAEELDIEPSADTVGLAGRIRQLMTLPPTNLSLTSLPVMDWSWELALILRYLTDPDSRVVTITGPETVAKSSLALYAGLRSNSRSGYFFLDGVYLVRLKAVRTAENLAAELGHVLGVTSTTRSIPLDMILRYLADKEMLLIFDYYDIPVEQRGTLATILDHAHGVKLLVNSQGALGLPNERLISIEQIVGSVSQQP